MKKVLVFVLLISVIYGCTSTRLVSNWKDPNVVLFHAYKVLIVGMTENESVRVNFENKLKHEFEKRDIEAVRSVDLFDVKFISSKQSEKELAEVEQQLLDKDFDAILYTKIVSTEDKKRLRSKQPNTLGFLNTFQDDYIIHQGIFYEYDYYNTFSLFHVETALYCICVDKERQTIWRAGIDITNRKNFNKSIDEYVQLLVSSMENQELIFHEKK
ncbi:hypothetical protein JQC67_10620 [Aurantibacter crassamenti]|uniref:hypothetical protein n=1 Tax=Aurantibacter crassamenti TaxID=1837375 RepID=UPI001939C761|nr:hypothetical protein [Aurantibacter crassamenti]MBM1106592.1 hypothetical protein [Aurantibacter crassamenti]